MAKFSRAKAVRAHCKDCAGGTSKLVAVCPSLDCALWPYRTSRKGARKDRSLFEENLDLSENEMYKLILKVDRERKRQ